MSLPSIAGLLIVAAGAVAADPAATQAWVGRQYHADPKTAASATVASVGGVRLARWSGDRAAAFSFIFDDGSTDHTAIVIPVLEANGLRGTFALVTGRVLPDTATAAAKAEKARQAEKDPAKAARIRVQPSWDDWRAAAVRGHELANHSISHPNFAKMTDEAVTAEIIGGLDGLRAGAGVTGVTFVGPGNQYGKNGLEVVRAHHLCWRIGGGIGYGIPPAGEEPATSAAKWTARLQALITHGGWTLSMIHAITEGYEPVGEQAFRLHIAQAAALGDRLWIAPAGEVARYDLAVRHARLAVESTAAQALRLRVEPGLDDPLLLVPLTVVVPTGAAAASATATRAGAALPCRIAGERLLVEVVPGASAVEIAWR
jgi:peptidoglycan/xylan/chitin deacetylase (PgdA/CDA1 family)